MTYEPARGMHAFDGQVPADQLPPHPVVLVSFTELGYVHAQVKTVTGVLFTYRCDVCGTTITEVWNADQTGTSKGRDTHTEWHRQLEGNHDDNR